MNKIVLTAVLLFSLLTGRFQESEELELNLSRDFGYGGPNGDIQGRFSMIAEGPADLQRVVFLIDDQSIGEDSEPPFRLQFQTDNYELGRHALSATGFTSDGRELHSRALQRNFVAASEGWRSGLRIGGLVAAAAAVAMTIAGLLTALANRNQASTPLGAPRNYGVFGGAVCPKCGRPFALHIWKMNLLVGALDRCPHCGRWSLVQRAHPAVLRAAEEAELEQAAEPEPPPLLSEEERLRKLLDESRFDDR
jgi:hypothetical protein